MASPAKIILPFVYRYAVDGTVEEGTETSQWLKVTSGAYLHLKGGKGMTVQGDLPATDKWAVKYKAENPLDTKDGVQPQNIIRFHLRDPMTTNSLTVAQCFTVKRINAIESPNRDDHNGILLMTNYSVPATGKAGYNFYDFEIRVDGKAIIKKKKAGSGALPTPGVNGTYYNISPYVTVLPGTYDRKTNPSLLPLDTCIALKMEQRVENATQLRIIGYMDVGCTGAWKKVVEGFDDGIKYGGAVLPPGNVGVRTDFMDCEFDDLFVGSAGTNPPLPPAETADYKKGWNAALDAVVANANSIRKT